MIQQTTRQQRLQRLKMATTVVLAVVSATFGKAFGVVSIRRYFKIARQRFAIDDTNMLVRYWASNYQQQLPRYRGFRQCFDIAIVQVSNLKIPTPLRYMVKYRAPHSIHVISKCRDTMKYRYRTNHTILQHCKTALPYRRYQYASPIFGIELSVVATVISRF